MQKSKFFLLLLTISTLALPITTLAAGNAGKIFLQVEAHGEAWYINPTDNLRYYLGKPEDAFSLMRKLGVGITTDNLKKIPIGIVDMTGQDLDQDLLPDNMEEAIGTDKNNPDTDGDDYSDYEELDGGFNPLGPGRVPTNQTIINNTLGKILLQVEAKGEAWYVNPSDGKRYFLGRPTDALAVMRAVGVGITNARLAAIPVIYQKSDFDGTSYSLKQPTSWTHADTTPTKTTAYGSATITNQITFSSDVGNATITVRTLQSAKDLTLNSLAKKSISNTELIHAESLMIGIKPAQEKVFHYTKKFTQKDLTIDRGALVLVDIMLNTREFINIELFVPNKADIELYQPVLDNLIKDFRIK